jgi:hypothetical protein
VPRYFFHVFNDETSLDEEGIELPDLETARAHAIKGARSLMSDSLKRGRIVPATTSRFKTNKVSCCRT